MYLCNIILIDYTKKLNLGQLLLKVYIIFLFCGSHNNLNIVIYKTKK